MALTKLKKINIRCGMVFYRHPSAKKNWGLVQLPFRKRRLVSYFMVEFISSSLTRTYAHTHTHAPVSRLWSDSSSTGNMEKAGQFSTKITHF